VICTGWVIGSQYVDWIPVCRLDPSMSIGSQYVDWIPVCRLDPSMSIGFQYIDWIPVCRLDPSMSIGFQYVDWIPVCRLDPSMSRQHSVLVFHGQIEDGGSTLPRNVRIDVPIDERHIPTLGCYCCITSTVSRCLKPTSGNLLEIKPLGRTKMICDSNNKLLLNKIFVQNMN
jgi:hypothetical protein